MNYGISILFRAIPLVMALFCFGYGAFIYGYGDAGNASVAQLDRAYGYGP